MPRDVIIRPAPARISSASAAAATAEDGGYRFRTILPGRVPGPGNSLQAPHIAVGVMARGLLKRLVTRLYFPDGEGLESDPILELVPPDRRDTLIARKNPAVIASTLFCRAPAKPSSSIAE